MLDEEQYHLLSELAQRDSVMSMSGIVKSKILANFQCVSVVMAAIVERAVISLDTGMGKTLVATGIINLLKAIGKANKWIFVCKNDNIEEIYNKLRDGLYNMVCDYCTGQSAEIFRAFTQNRMHNTDVVIISYEAFREPYVNGYLYRNRSDFNGIIFDESHEFANGSSQVSQLVSVMLKTGFKYSYMLTATPLRVSPVQFGNQISMLDPEVLGTVNIDQEYGIWSDGSLVGYQNLEELQRRVWYRYINFTRAELNMEGNYLPVLIICEPKESYKDLAKQEAFKVICGDSEGPAMQALTELIVRHKHNGKKGLIYVNTNDNKDRVKNHLEQFGLSVGIRDGKHTNTVKKKTAVKDAFNEGKYDALITNLVTGSDLQCDFICYFEETFDYVQFNGRGERGLKGSDLELDFIIVSDTPQVRYFYENVYKRVLMLEQACGKHVDSIKKIKNQLLDAMNIDTDLDMMNELSRSEEGHQFTEVF